MTEEDTRYVGLTQRALDFVSYFVKKPQSPNSLGLRGENVPLSEWAWTYQDRQYVLREVIQESRWREGPMLFTCLEVEWTHPIADEVKPLPSRLFEWMADPTVAGVYQPKDFDRATGRYWV